MKVVRGRALRQNPRKQQRSTGSSVARDLLALTKSYPNQIVTQMWLEANPVKLTTTVTTGVIANGYAIASSSLAAFATKFGSTFVEYRIVRAKLQTRNFSSTNPGIMNEWIDEKVTSVPTLAESKERATLVFSSSSVGQAKQIDWICTDLLDLQFIDIGTSTTVATFKQYTDNANYGASAVATDYCEIGGKFLVQFRGLK